MDYRRLSIDQEYLLDEKHTRVTRSKSLIVTRHDKQMYKDTHHNATKNLHELLIEYNSSKNLSEIIPCKLKNRSSVGNISKRVKIHNNRRFSKVFID